MTAGSLPRIDIDPAPRSPAASATQLGQSFIDAVVSRDFDGIEALVAPGVRFRALVPRALHEATTAAGARELIESWFGDTNRNQLIESTVGMVADKLHVAYRMQLRKDGAWCVIEQQLFGSLSDARLTDVALVCSGFRPVEVLPGDDSPSPTTSHHRRVDARFDAIGKSCATLTPDIRTAVRQLEPGQVLEIVTDDPTAEEGLRSWTRLTGNELVDMTTRPDATGLFYVQRGPESTPRASLTGADS